MGVINGTPYDYVFPVEMGGGQSQIYWNRGDDVKAVAAQFALRHGVGLDERDEIERFMQMAAGSAPSGGGPAPPPAAPTQQLGPAEITSRIQQLVSMGFDPQRCQAALQQAGWDVEAALGMLLG